jgi:class 3 adenylate cyclase
VEKYSVYLPIDRLIAIQQGVTLPNQTWGTALFADISGFTPLTEALVREFGSQRGAEELTRYINSVYEELISCLYNYGGSVISFAGDAITCWFDQDDGLQAAACALGMQDAMQQFANINVASSRAGTHGLTVTLAVKIALATGPARRFVVGNPDILLIDVLGGSTLYDLAKAEHQAEKGEIILAPAVVKSLDTRVEISVWRTDHDEPGVRFGVLMRLLAPAQPKPFPALSDASFKEEDLRAWLLPPVYQRLQQGQGEFLAELRPALALFLNFTGIDFDHDEAAGDKLNKYILWAQKILARYDAYIFQLIVGDKGNYLYAAFGAPVAHEDDAVRAVSAALDLLAPPTELNYIEEIKIGISRGRLHTGAYGSSQRRTYGMLGDDVNLAARLMQAAQPGQILTNQTVKQSTGNFFRWETLPEIRVKGKAEPVAVFSPLGMQPRQAMRLHTLNYSLPMVGRETELALIDEKIKQGRQGQGQLLGITGEAGIGKSRLVHEVVLRADDAGFYFYDGECQSIAVDSSYWVWQPIWRSIFKLDLAQSNAEQITAIEKYLSAIDPALVSRLPLLEAVTNLTIPDTELTAALDAKLRKTSLESLLVDCLRAAAAQHPMVIVLENCQWMDALSHELAEILGRTAYELPVLIVLVYRPVELERLKTARISRLRTLPRSPSTNSPPNRHTTSSSGNLNSLASRRLIFPKNWWIVSSRRRKATRSTLRNC